MNALLQFPMLFSLPEPRPEPEWLDMREIKSFQYTKDVIYVELENDHYWVIVKEAVCSPKPQSFNKNVLSEITAKQINGTHVVSVGFLQPHLDIHIGYWRGPKADLARFLVVANHMLGLPNNLPPPKQAA